MKNLLYVADILGSKLIRKRKIKKNLSHAGTTKTLNIASALKSYVNSMYIYSPGSPAENKFIWYPSITELIQCSDKKKIKIQYGFAYDLIFIRGIVSFFSTLIFLPKIIIKKSINIIIIYNLTFTNMLTIILAKLFGLKILLEYEDSATASRVKSKNIIKSFFFIYEFIASKLVDGILAPTKKLTLQIKDNVIIPGIVGDDIISKINKSNKIYNCKSNIPLKIIYAGGFDKSKGIDIFLKAINLIDFKIKMIVTGAGPMAPQIKKLCTENKHSIKFYKGVRRDKLIKYLNWADVGINAHLNIHAGGSWPFKVVEYLATCGTVFSNKIDGMPEQLKSKLFLYKGDSMQDVYDGFKLFIKNWPKLRNTANIRRKWAIKNYSTKKIGKQIINLL
jgi:glycosyltransferase involved in cell wall biosynthesis